MPDWKRVIGDIARNVEKSAKETRGRQLAQQRQGHYGNRGRPENTCLFWDCSKPIRDDHVFCYDHYNDLLNGSIDECPGCNRGKYIDYDLCLDCHRKSSTLRTRRTSNNTQSHRWYKPEYSSAWDKHDAQASRFFVYILKLDGGKSFYAGQTRELRERLSEHKDGKVASTARRNPELVWFGILPTRDAATTTEVELKKLIDTNEREIRRMIIDFRDLIGELNYS
jgi:predicted GIY-YIG superfamily endonuclease